MIFSSLHSTSEGNSHKWKEEKKKFFFTLRGASNMTVVWDKYEWKIFSYYKNPYYNIFTKHWLYDQYFLCIWVIEGKKNMLNKNKTHLIMMISNGYIQSQTPKINIAKCIMHSKIVIGENDKAWKENDLYFLCSNHYIIKYCMHLCMQWLNSKRVNK